MRRLLPLILASFLAGLPLAAAPPDARAGAGTPDAVLAKLDRWNASLKTFRAEISQRKFSQILEEFEEPELGLLQYKRTGQGVFLRKEITRPSHSILLVTPEQLLVYYPKKKQALRRKLEESQSRYVNFGVGISSAELKKNFRVAHTGDEAVSGKNCHVLELDPQSEKIRQYFKSIRLWVEAATGVPLRQQIEEHNGDYLEIDFLKITLNPALGGKTFELALPRDVEYIQ